MKLKVDLECGKCCKKVKKVLAKYPREFITTCFNFLLYMCYLYVRITINYDMKILKFAYI